MLKQADRSPGSLAPPWAPRVAIIAALTAGVIGAAVWNRGDPGVIDAWGIHVLAASRHTFPYRFASRVDDTVRTLGVLTWSMVTAVVAWVLLRRWEAIVTAFVVAPATVAVELLIKVAGRRTLGLEIFGYPSGRVALATSLVLTLLLVLRAAAVPPLVLRLIAVSGGAYVLVMAWARVATSRHVLSEVMGGVSTGVAVTLVVVLVITKWAHRVSTADDG
jgi:membrane-associated phospholipid phosphatase